MEKKIKDDIAQIVIETLKARGMISDDRAPPHINASAQPSSSVATDQRLFDLMETRFNAIDTRFTELREDMNKRFDDVNKRFEDVNKRFDDVNKRFEDMNKRFTFIQWLIAGSATLITVLISVYQFLN